MQYQQYSVADLLHELIGRCGQDAVTGLAAPQVVQTRRRMTDLFRFYTPPLGGAVEPS